MGCGRMAAQRIVPQSVTKEIGPCPANFRSELPSSHSCRFHSRMRQPPARSNKCGDEWDPGVGWGGAYGWNGWGGGHRGLHRRLYGFGGARPATTPLRWIHGTGRPALRTGGGKSAHRYDAGRVTWLGSPPRHAQTIHAFDGGAAANHATVAPAPSVMVMTVQASPCTTTAAMASPCTTLAAQT
jgi:hypothetical protein